MTPTTNDFVRRKKIGPPHLMPGRPLAWWLVGRGAGDRRGAVAGSGQPIPVDAADADRGLHGTEVVGAHQAVHIRAPRRPLETPDTSQRELGRPRDQQ